MALSLDWCGIQRSDLHSECKFPDKRYWSLLAPPRLRDDFLGIFDFLEFARSPLFVALILVRMILPNQRLELLLQPSALDVLAPLLEVNR